MTATYSLIFIGLAVMSFAVILEMLLFHYLEKVPSLTIVDLSIPLIAGGYLMMKGAENLKKKEL